MSYRFLMDLALILLSTKLLGIITRRIQLPHVVGALLAGLVLGPAMLNVLQETEFITQLSELGVIVLMFTAGLDTDIKELQKTGKAAFVIAVLGVLFPLAGGFALAHAFNEGDPSLSASTMMQNICIGVILTATTVSITVETLKEIGKLSTTAGNAILGAALIDDILGIIALTLVTSTADPSVNLWMVLGKILAFFLFAGVVGWLFHRFFAWWVAQADKGLQRFVIIAFVFCLLMSYCAEEFFGVADITGSFIAGVILSTCQRTKYIASRFSILSYMLLSPIFFASIGIKVELPAMSAQIVLFSVLLLVMAVITKIIGCGLGAKMMGFTNEQAMQVGTGMISRGEVALIVANKGSALGLMSATYFGPIVIMIVFTTIVTPILLKMVFARSHEELIDSNLVENYKETSQLDLAEQTLLSMHADLRAKKPGVNPRSFFDRVMGKKEL